MSFKNLNTQLPNRALLTRTSGELHPAWKALMILCRDLGHGEIEHLKIQNGLPVLAEKVTEKIKLT